MCIYINMGCYLGPFEIFYQNQIYWLCMQEAHKECASQLQRVQSNTDKTNMGETEREVLFHSYDTF